MKLSVYKINNEFKVSKMMNISQEADLFLNGGDPNDMLPPPSRLPRRRDREKRNTSGQSKNNLG